MNQNEYDKNEHINVSKTPVHGESTVPITLTHVIESINHNRYGNVENRVHQIDAMAGPCYNAAALRSEAIAHFDGLKVAVEAGNATYSSPESGDIIQARSELFDFIWFVTRHSEHYSCPFPRANSPFMRDFSFEVSGEEFVALDVSSLSPFYVILEEPSATKENYYSFLELGFDTEGNPVTLNGGRTGECKFDGFDLVMPLKGFVSLVWENSCMTYAFDPELDDFAYKQGNNGRHLKDLTIRPKLTASKFCSFSHQSELPCSDGYVRGEDTLSIDTGFPYHGTIVNQSRSQIRPPTGADCYREVWETRRDIQFDSTGHLIHVSNEFKTGEDPIFKIK